jgi:hypothetical protein
LIAGKVIAPYDISSIVVCHSKNIMIENQMLTMHSKISCPISNECQFFKKYNKNAESYKYVYCEGSKQESCARYYYKDKNGVKPPDELTPTGVLINLDE